MKYFYFISLFFSLLFNAQRYTSRWYGMDQGLPQNSVKDIVKDKYGFIWLATDSGILRFEGTYFIPYNNHKVKNISFKDFLRYGKDGFIIFNNWEEDCVLIKDRTVQRPNTKVFRTFFIQNGKQYKRFYKNSFINNFYPDIDSYYIKTTSDTYFFNGKDVQYVTKKGIKKTISENFPLKLLGNSFECNDIVYMGEPENRRTILFNKGKISYDNQPSLYNDPKTKIYWHQGTKQIFIIALEIMEKYKNHPLSLARGTVLPVKSNQKMNEYLKEVAELSKINTMLNTHKARRTFASTITLNNGVPIHVVKEMLGHHSIKQTEEYAITEHDSISKEMTMLGDRLTRSIDGDTGNFKKLLQKFEEDLDNLKKDQLNTNSTDQVSAISDLAQQLHFLKIMSIKSN